MPHALIRNVVALHDTRLGIVAEIGEPPTAWFIQQLDDRRNRSLPACSWFHVLPLEGGAILLAEPLAVVVREATSHDALVAWQAANEFGRATLQRLFPEVTFPSLPLEPRGPVPSAGGLTQLGADDPARLATCEAELNGRLLEAIEALHTRNESATRHAEPTVVDLGLDPPAVSFDLALEWRGGSVPRTRLLWMALPADATVPRACLLELEWSNEWLLAPDGLKTEGSVSYWTEFLVAEFERRSVQRLVGCRRIPGARNSGSYFARADQRDLTECKVAVDGPEARSPGGRAGSRVRGRAPCLSGVPMPLVTEVERLSRVMGRRPKKSRVRVHRLSTVELGTRYVVYTS